MKQDDDAQKPTVIQGRKPESAPKDGTMILASFKDVPHPVAAIWNAVDDAWNVAQPHCDIFDGEWNDRYFENERAYEMICWAEIELDIS